MTVVFTLTSNWSWAFTLDPDCHFLTLLFSIFSEVLTIWLCHLLPSTSFHLSTQRPLRHFPSFLKTLAPLTLFGLTSAGDFDFCVQDVFDDPALSLVWSESLTSGATEC